MTSREYIRKAMLHARRLGERFARLLGSKNKDKFVREFTRSMRHVVEKQAREWSGLPGKSKRMKESLRDIESDAAKK